MPCIVLTGGPGAGKTTLLAKLASMGYATVEESARAIIAERLASGLTRRPSPSEFARQILGRDVEKYVAQPQTSAKTYFTHPVCGRLERMPVPGPPTGPRRIQIHALKLAIIVRSLPTILRTMVHRFVQWSISQDQKLHRKISNSFPRTLQIADWFSSIIFAVVSHNLFNVISALVAGVLLVTGAIDRGVVTSLAAAWFITILWIAKSSPINKLTIPTRLLVVLVLGLLLAAITERFGRWSLEQYHSSQHNVASSHGPSDLNMPQEPKQPSPIPDITTPPSRSTSRPQLNPSTKATLPTMFFDCEMAAIPVMLNLGQVMNVLYVPTTRFSGMAQMFPNKNGVQYDFDSPIGFVPHCKLIDDGAVSVFNVLLPLAVTVREVLPGESGGALKSGAVVSSHTQTVHINRISNSEPYRFYVWNTSEYYIQITPPSHITLESGDVVSNAPLKLGSGTAVIAIPPRKRQ